MTKASIVPRPCLKWAGGKRELIKSIDQNGYIPENIETYYEPFFGAGAVFFYLWRTEKVEKAILSDLNFEIYNVHNQIKNNVHKLIEYSYEMDISPNERTYYINRDRFNDLRLKEKCSNDELLERAILMIYLNKNAYSGMYRENNKGQFNVPFGYYTNPTIIDEENLIEMNKSFKKVTFMHGDYEEILNKMKPNNNDFVYLDPPYMPCKGVSEFRKYNKNGFNINDQERLSEFYLKLTNNKIKTMLSNSTSEFISTLYKDIPHTTIKEISAKRAINAKNEGWKNVNEYLIMNY